MGLRQVLRKIGSVQTAAVLIGTLTIVLMVSTSLEAVYGTSFAQTVFYRTRWFDLLLALLALNIVSATGVRYPFKRRHAPFLLSHCGIILLLLGAFAARQSGFEGRFVLAEGETSDAVKENGYQLTVTEGKTERIFAIGRPGRLRRPKEAPYFALVRLEENSAPQTSLEEDPAGPINPAVELRLRSPSMRLEETIRLAASSPYPELSSQAGLGPLRVFLRQQEEQRDPLKGVLKIFSSTGRLLAAFDPAETLDGRSISPQYRVENFRYLSFAAVAADTLINDPAGRPNPAVQLDIVDTEGVRERHTKFAFLPQLDSRHGNAAEGFPLRLELVPPIDVEDGAPFLLVARDTAGKWTYQAQDSYSQVYAPIEAGSVIKTNFMDFDLQVVSLLSRARITRKPVRMPGGGNAALALRDGQGLRWLFEDEGEILQVGGRSVRAILSRAISSLPFSLQLADFRKIDYPGTTRAAGFESDVVLQDSGAGVLLKRTIKMNAPLDYRGYRIFQTSYSQDAAGKEVSILTVSKNPGLSLIYGGGILILLGVIFLFYGQTVERQ